MRISKFSLLALSLGLATACSGPAKPPSQQPVATETVISEPSARQFIPSEANPPRVYRNNSGITLKMLVLESKKGELPEALLQFTGASFPAAGKVMLAKDHGSTTQQNWKIGYDGSERHIVKIFLETSGTKKGELVVRLRMPRSGAHSKMQLDLDGSQAFDVDAFVATHRRHLSEGALEELARIDRKFHIEKHLNAVKNAQKSVAEECQQEIPFEIDFESFSDIDLSYKPVCRTGLDVIARVCRRDLHARADVLQRVSAIRCSSGEKNELHLASDGTLQVNMSDSQFMNRDKAYRRVKALLGLGRIVLEDDKKRIVVFDPDDNKGGGDSEILLGTATELHPLRHGVQKLRPWDPHAGSSSAVFERKDDGWEVQCRGKKIKFQPVSPKRRQSILKNAKLGDTLWKREEFSLARDNRGVYYYVDRFAPEFGGKNFRVFKGPRGQLEETKLVDIVDDSDGMIFATKRGKLRLVIGSEREQEALWIEGKTRHKLVVLPLFGNVDLIYAGLGVYDTEIMGTVCE